MQRIQAAKEAADAAFRQKQYALAIREYDNAVQLSEEHKLPDLLHVLYSNRSAAKLALKDFPGALVDAQASLAVNAQWLKGWFRSAKALQGLGKNDLALQAVQQALQLDTSNPEVLRLLQEIKLQREGLNSSQNTAHEKTTVPSKQHHQQHHHQQQQQQQQQAPVQPTKDQIEGVSQLPWSQVCRLRASLALQQLPHQLVAGSEYMPSADGVNKNLLLLLHGLGDKPAAFTALARRMALPQTASLALSGPLVVPETGGGRSWFEAYDDDWEPIQPRPGETRRVKSLETTLQLLQQQLLPALAASGAWQHEQIFMFGFSQGGSIALEMARRCRGQQRLGGVVAVSASLLEELLDNNSSSSSRDASSGPATDVLITHGDRDLLVTRTAVNKTATLLRSAGCDVQLKTLPHKGHGMIDSAEEMQACMAFWAARLKVRPVDPEFVEVPTGAAAQIKQRLR